MIDEAKATQEGSVSFPVDLIRTVAMVAVILLHAANDLTIQHLDQLEIFRWLTVDVYQSAGRMGVPLFLMLTGALLLQPSKKDSLNVFFKKRWARIGIPFLFWGAAFFAWDFLVKQQTFTSSFIIQGVLSGPYYHFWYIYMLVGLYLLTPILRLITANADGKIMKYFVVLWFVGASVAPLAGLFTSYHLDGNVFTITSLVGYFILGTYLLTVKISRRTLFALISLGIGLTAIGTYAMAATIGGGRMYFFQEYLSPTMIFTTIVLFLLLNTVKPPLNRKNVGHSKVNTLLNLISVNTLPVFFLHVIVLETIQLGYLGFALNGNVVNSIIGVPLMTVIVLFICLAIIVPLKKVPFVAKIIG
jgi:surface polysaccharide O-acyltransferase-like enzyme